MSLPLPEPPAERLKLAYGYPYAIPDPGYLLQDGRVAELRDACFEGRLPVLAHGSNRAPEQLGRKFPKGQIPVTKGWLKDHIVVYAACLTRYGACPSLLWSFRGAEVQVSINWLTPEQLGIMHRTEGNYAFGRLEADFRPEEGPEPEILHVYHGHPGALLLDGNVTALSAATARGSGLPLARDQREVLSKLQALAGIGATLSDFVLQMIEYPQQRAAFVRKLKNYARPANLPGFQLCESAPA